MALEHQTPHNMHLGKIALNMSIKVYEHFYSPEKILAIAAIQKLRMTPGPAMFFATIPATKYMPVPQQEPIPSEVKSIVVRHFCEGRFSLF